MSGIFDSILATPEAQDAFSERSFVDAMLRFAAALARAQAAEGLIPESAAQSITGTCKVELFDVAKICRESARAGSVAIPMVKTLKETVGLFNPDAVAWVHFGVIGQDVIDTAMALVTQRALRLIEADTRVALDALLALAQTHEATPMLARTLLQPASVITFGLKCVGWAAPLARSLARLRLVSGRALQLQLGGAVGTRAEMKAAGARVARRMAADLSLAEPVAAWHTQRDEWVALACELGLLAGSLGKIALDISLLSQFEVGEVAEPAVPGRGGSSTMAFKHNPVGCMVALTAAQRAPQRVATLLAGMAQEHERALGGWQAELAEWPQLVMLAHGSVRAMAQALPALQVNVDGMRANLDAVRASLPADAAQAWFNPALVAQAAAQARAQLAGLRGTPKSEPAGEPMPEPV